MQDLNATLVQCQLAWEKPEDNRGQFASIINGLAARTDLVVLPETFTTGFSMNALANAEKPGGETEQWLQDIALAHDCAVTGSIAVEAEGKVFNRMLFATPGGLQYYDKRHLFRMAGEHKRYAPGSDRVLVNWRGWRINLQVCYDLRFPVFSRNRDDYDMLIYVANWPALRSQHWRALLIARAIENQAAVIGVNRVGSDANGLEYSGDSLAVSPEGALLADLSDREEALQVRFDGAALQAYRERFPCHMDADAFTLD